MKKFVKLFILLLCMLFVLASCGNKGSFDYEGDISVPDNTTEDTSDTTGGNEDNGESVPEEGGMEEKDAPEGDGPQWGGFERI